MAERRDYKTLIDAVDRYINSTKYPDLDTVLAILGVEKRENYGNDTELRHLENNSTRAETARTL